MRFGRVIVVSICSFFVLGLTTRAQSAASAGGSTPGGPAERDLIDTRRSGEETAVAQPLVADAYRPLTGKERWNIYLRDAFWSPGVFFRAAGPALGAHLNNEPPVWGQGTEGYTKRFANRFARFALQETYEAAAAAALGHEVRYLRSRRSGFLPRAAHALAADFVTYDRNGRRTPNVARVGSVFAAEFTGRLWMPAGYRDASTSMRGVGMQLGVSSGFNLIREFAPELKRVFKRK